ncbi:MAG: decarboxylating 6-phosphogluconate dehydrogenase [Acidimicrobiales bacterium]
MQLAMVGLGRMGANMVRRLMADGHDCVVFDVNAESVTEMQSEGATGAASLAELVAATEAPRSVWIMVPAAYVDGVIDELTGLLGADDTIIDGGNSYYRDDVDRALALRDSGIHYLDVGTSGGVFGLERGYSLMIGGDQTAVDRLIPVFDSLAPGIDSAERTPGMEGAPHPGEKGWLHCGIAGSGHFVKMVHNGIEYGMMAALAEGLGILEQAGIGRDDRPIDAETTPMRDPQYFQFDIDVPAVAEVWRRGSVVSSWLVDLTAKALHEDPDLATFEGRVSDSGEGRWTVMAAIDEGVPAPVISAALYQRFSSRGRSDFSDRSLSAMRKEFGGHHEKKSDD